MSDPIQIFESKPPFELRFSPLYFRGAALSFPCDAKGRVDMDELSGRARENYLFARAMVGKEYSTPMVVAPAADPLK